MKLRTILLLFALSIVFIVVSQVQTEKQTILFTTSGDQTVLIKPGSFVEQDISFEKSEYPVRRTLRVVGGVVMPGKFAPRGEEYFRQQEYLIDDNLDSINTFKNQYSLYFRGNNEPFERHVYNRITGVDFSKGTLEMSIAYKRNKLKQLPNGDFGVELQVYLQRENRFKDDIYDRADTVIYIPIPEGSGKYTTLRKKIKIPKSTAAVLVRVGGTHFSGECWVEAPEFSMDGKNIFNSPFVQNEKRKDNYNYWVGVNMVSRSWPKWKLEFNGRTIFNDFVFDRASNIADFYITLPLDISGNGKLRLTLEKQDYRANFPYQLRSLQLLEESARDFEIVSVPKYPALGDTVSVLLEINNPDIQLKISSDNSNLKIIDTVLSCQKTGLYAVRILALEPAEKVKFNVSDGKSTRYAFIDQFIQKPNDLVYLSSGDEIHIDKVPEHYDRFFKWYMRERIGNWYHFRPSYQWSGVRITDESVIKNYTSLLNKMHMPYAWQVEGRTLASTRINPSLESLQSPMFRGKQAHENDGGYYYWQHFHYNGLHSDMAARTRPFGGIFAKHRPIYTDHGTFIHYDPFAVKNMEDGAERFVANLSYSRGESTRHTGPSGMFRYLYQAGYDWLGAEQMYGPEDVIMSALRGASRAYGKQDYGSLHAVQWGSGPFTDPKHSLRFYLSLATAYVHGSSHINTEEGLWTDEYANDRFTKSGKEHLFAQHQMLDYIQTHERKGRMHTPIAVIQGRDDAWKSFGRTAIWSQIGDKWKFNKAMESFDLLKVFYPENNLDYCSKGGLFTSTPFGLVDILPIEASSDVLNSYKVLIFLGWNSFKNADFIRLKRYVEQGGNLMLTAVHLNSELQPDLPVKYPEDDIVIRSLLGENYKSIREKTKIRLGKGTIIFYPENVYPADELIRNQYVADMKMLATNATGNETNKAWVKPQKYINFSVWDTDKYRTIYLLNVDWESNEKSQPAVIQLQKSNFDVDVERYKITTIRCFEGMGALLNNNTSDILEIQITDVDKYIFICQTTQPDKLTVFDGKSGEKYFIDIKSAGIHRVELSNSKLKLLE